MLLTISTTHEPATDLGYLLHKNPARVHSRGQSYGTAHVFYSEVNVGRCTAVLYVDVDPVGLVRGRKGPGGEGLLDQYVNDRPYAASSLLTAAMNEVFGSALNGRSDERPELAATPIPLVFELPCIASRGGEGLLRSLFGPLGYRIESASLPLDPHFASWGDSAYFDVRLSITEVLKTALSHLYVLIPVLDNDKHYWVGEDEVEKLLRRGEPWLAVHPERDLIVRRYLKHRRSLADLAIARLVAADDGVEDEAESERVEVVGGDTREQGLERPLSLNDRRLAAVAAVADVTRAATVIDLGCGEGKLLKRLLALSGISRIVGVDVSHRALEMARDRLKLERMPKIQKDKLTLIQGSLIYRDARFSGFDMAAVVEVVEHLDESRLEAFTRVLFEAARPRNIVMTTPNREYNVRFAGLPAGRLRHPDHRFEWTRVEFESWASERARRFAYDVRFESVGDVDEAVGAPTQMAVFTALA